MSTTATTDGCLVDRCALCESVFVNTCMACENGYYLRTFDSQKKYNDCWNIYYLWAAVIAVMLLFLLAAWGCYFCYKRGKSNGFRMYQRRRAKQRKNFDDEIPKSKKKQIQRPQETGPSQRQIEIKPVIKLQKQQQPIVQTQAQMIFDSIQENEPPFVKKDLSRPQSQQQVFLPRRGDTYTSTKMDGNINNNNNFNSGRKLPY